MKNQCSLGKMLEGHGSTHTNLNSTFEKPKKNFLTRRLVALFPLFMLVVLSFPAKAQQWENSGTNGEGGVKTRRGYLWLNWSNRHANSELWATKNLIIKSYNHEGSGYGDLSMNNFKNIYLNPSGRLKVSGDIYTRGHLWLHAYQGDGKSGVAYIQARDDSGNSNIGLQLRSQSNGVIQNALSISPDGNVGIGTRTPNEKLHVYGNGIISENLSIDGNVGIGTTTPNEKLEVSGNIKADGYNYSAGWISNAIGSDEDYGANAVGVYGSSGGHLNMVSGGGSGRIYLKNDGNVGIGTTDPGIYKLAVEGKIGARGVDVKAGSWADFVFDEAYALKPLTEVAAYIDAHHHLPDVPSEAEVTEKGIDVAEMLKIQMQKIEELTLYMIELKKENEELKKAMFH